MPILPQRVWQALPYADDALEAAAAVYYGCRREAILAVPGSQYALQFTPTLLRKGKVAMPQRGYAEHRAAWQAAGHQVIDYTDGAALHELVIASKVDHALVINPNNPTGEVLSVPQLQDLHQRLHRSGGWLVVDEAFMDAAGHDGLAPLCPAAGLIVYRSLGKFFGLAGVRLGFLLAQPELCEQLAAIMPPWLVSHPARWIGAAALGDRQWQVEQQRRLVQSAKAWQHLLGELLPDLSFTGTCLFASAEGDAIYCEALYHALGRRGVLLRLFEAVEGRRLLRFGLPLPTARERVVRLIRESVEECKCAKP